jgi:hypothetical protein
MGALIPWIHVTISGFVYVSFFFFLTLLFAKKYDLNYKNIKDYLPYIAIMVVFLSYAVGFSIHLMSQEVYYYFSPRLKILSDPINTKMRLQGNIYDSYNNSYSNLVMLRHLTIATFLLGIVLPFWFYRKTNAWRYSIISFCICLLGSFIFFVSYCNSKQTFIELEKTIRNFY